MSKLLGLLWFVAVTVATWIVASIVWGTIIVPRMPRHCLPYGAGCEPGAGLLALAMLISPIRSG